MVKKLSSQLFGNLRITVRGSSIERFLNICIKNEIKLYNIKRKDETCMYASISIRHFRYLLYYMGRTGCHVHIIKRRGLPFLLNKLHKRYALWVGTFLAIVSFFYILNKFISFWIVDKLTICSDDICSFPSTVMFFILNIGDNIK